LHGRIPLWCTTCSSLANGNAPIFIIIFIIDIITFFDASASSVGLSVSLCVSSLQGPRMVRDVFRLAKENAPSIIFIDEVDAIATARFDAQTGADREVQRILMELLNQMDGFDQTVNVKVSLTGVLLHV
jgi:ATP-dependent Zn protease